MAREHVAFHHLTLSPANSDGQPRFPPMPFPATDFAAECAALYPEGFRHPAEYLPTKIRITDPAFL